MAESNIHEGNAPVVCVPHIFIVDPGIMKPWSGELGMNKKLIYHRVSADIQIMCTAVRRGRQ
jgi:hypothetical protein